MSSPRDVGIVLVVDTSPRDLAFLARTLRDAGYAVAEAETFDWARSLLSAIRPNLLISEIQLGAYNGLHLVLLRQTQQPIRPSIVTSVRPDGVLETEAARLGCPFLVKPIDPTELLELAARLLGADEAKVTGRSDRRESARTAMAGSVEVLVGDTSIPLADVSYGGCRLRWPPHEKPLPPVLTFVIPATNTRVDVVPVWRQWAGEAETVGAAVQGEAEVLERWRAFVNGVRPT